MQYYYAVRTVYSHTNKHKHVIVGLQNRNVHYAFRSRQSNLLNIKYSYIEVGHLFATISTNPNLSSSTDFYV